MTSLVFEVNFSLTSKFSSLPKEVTLNLKDAGANQLSKPHSYHLTSTLSQTVLINDTTLFYGAQAKPVNLSHRTTQRQGHQAIRSQRNETDLPSLN